SGTLSIAGLTFTVTQAGAAPGACTYTLAPTAVSVGMAATNGSVTVNTTPTCRWTASSAASWISITSGASGTGSGTVRFSVAANTTAVTRNGALTIAGLNFVVTQAGNAVCTYDLTPTSIRFSAGSGSSSFRVTTGGSCRWTARPSVSWITITGGANGTGNGRVQFQVSRNQNSRQRTGTITVADQTFTVYQSAGSSGGESGSTFGTIQVAEAAGRQRLTVELVVRNADQKPESAKQPAVYLSNDAKVDKADTLLWTRAVPELAPGEDATHKFRVTLPAGVSTHGKYLVAIPDTRLALIGEAKPIAVYGPLQ
ncbi:MAG: BACON domain-containing carbohydrate-binding protein, partial [Kiritimatiellaeota bacterium]|nr:BACON domain-containing carbohydrate-binding protein [Kiritimatiellota bacterium]